MSCRTSTAPPPPLRATGQGELPVVGLLSPQGGAELCRDIGMADHFYILPADGRRVHAEHRLRRAVGQLQPAAPVDHEHAFDHPGQNRLHARAVA